MRLRTSSTVSAALLLSLTGLASRAHAQTATGFALDSFNPSERGSDWFAADSLDLRGQLRPAIGIVGDYGWRPLVLYNANGAVADAVVRDQLYAHLGASLNLWSRLRVSFDLPIAIWQDGTTDSIGTATYRAGTSSGVGDLRLGADVRIAGKYGQPFTLALGAQVFLPTGDSSSYLGDGSVRLLPHVAIAGDVKWFTYAANVGFLYRPADDSFGPYARGSELTFGASAGVRLADKRLIVGPEVYGSTVVTSASAVFSRASTPVEGLLGAHYAIAADWHVGLGAGTGFTQGIGEPALRIVASAEWAPAFHDKLAPSAPAEPLAVSDRDHDRIVDEQDACPDVPGVPTLDPKNNGCPLALSDRDGDNVLDTLDACPDVPGVASNDPKTNGCPVDQDRDKDGIANEVDACPDQPGPKSDDPKTSVCPMAFVDKGQIKILQQVNFATGSAAIVPGKDSVDVLHAVLVVLGQHPEIARIRVEGHTDDVGAPAYNKKLSADRAAQVALWLEKNGIDKSRLANTGWGPERPLEANTTPEGRKQNRRVEFHIEALSSK
jgi:OmpA-OmpF porin, OOP family